MHDDSTHTDHTLRDHCQTPGGLAKMTHWWDCSCGWKSDRGTGYDGFHLAEAAAREHAARHGVPYWGPPDDCVTPEDQGNWYLQQIPDDAPLWGSLARVLLSAARTLACEQAAAEAVTSAAEAPTPKPKRKPRIKPSKLAAWEAQRQAKQAGEAES